MALSGAVLAVAEVVFAEESLLVQLELLFAPLVSHSLRLLERHGDLSGALCSWSVSENFLSHLFRVDPLVVGRVPLLARAEIDPCFDGALFLSLCSRPIGLTEDILRLDLRHVPLVAWDFVSHACVISLLAHGHFIDLLSLLGLTDLG